ncbi:polysaccharide pyruvyl transferase family protein [Patulibacter sp. SYSU D01012]|uniref:polysaccharide pyruvyl transferase family protein n=1 Tax=Patulibacter sp. SYSU D01012 TaxID=2817381 RepID=UPI001B30107A
MKCTTLPRVQYLGLAGYGNVGDDAIRDAFIREFDGRLMFSDVPVGRKATIRRGLRHWATDRGRPVLLGGGTVLGRTLWRQHFGLATKLYRPSGWEMLGAGVEDPDFVGDRTYSSWDEIRAWRPLLEPFSSVSVRGPRSRAILQAAGIDARVVGDPALLLSADTPPPPQADRDIDVLVNVTCGEDQWGGTDLDWTPAVVDALRHGFRGSGRLVFVSMDPIDDTWNRRVAHALGIAAPVLRPSSPDAFLALARRSRVVLGTRLHANVLSAAAGTPTVSLEYRPKCRDFMESVGIAHLCHRVDELTSHDVRASLDETLDDWEHHREQISAAVASLRDLLAAEVGLIARRLAA